MSLIGCPGVGPLVVDVCTCLARMPKQLVACCRAEKYLVLALWEGRAALILPDQKSPFELSSCHLNSTKHGRCGKLSALCLR
eukprot:2418742-Amphidinium_carterae.1